MDERMASFCRGGAINELGSIPLLSSLKVSKVKTGLVTSAAALQSRTCMYVVVNHTC